MEDKTKFYIFDKKEIALIFTFMILASLITFTLGIKVGKSYSDQSSCISEEDRLKVDLLSSEEEVVQNMDDIQPESKKENFDDNSQLEAALDELNKKSEPTKPVETSLIENVDKAEVTESSDVHIAKSKEDQFYNKYTIQLGSYRSIEDAKEFANGFKARGYDPIINEVTIPSKGGVWYRVGIGVFNSSSDAKEYINKHRSLFQSHNDYVIGKFD